MRCRQVAVAGPPWVEERDMRTRLLNLLVPALVAFLAAAASASAQSFEVLQRFQALPAQLNGPLVQGNDGLLYGTSFAGGDFGFGAIFRVDPGGMSAEVLHSFNGFTGRRPKAGLVLANDGLFYGAAERGGAWDRGTVFRVDSTGAVHVLHAFDEFGLTGSYPSSPLYQASDGNLYGTTSGRNIYRIVLATGAYELLHTLTNLEGNVPSALVQATDGFLYGTASLGGPFGRGTIFRLDLSGTVEVLHAFSTLDTPVGPLVEGPDLRLYGTTSGGNASCGTIFRLQSDGSITTLHNFGPFTGSLDGACPSGGLITVGGVFYGATQRGGPADVGVIYRIDAAGVYSVIYRSDGEVGAHPARSPLTYANGVLFGAAGSFDGVPTVFTVTLTGDDASTVYAFDDGVGRSPSSLVNGGDGFFYGVNTAGLGGGRLIRIDLSGVVGSLHEFDPLYGAPSLLIAGGAGTFYGLTQGGTDGGPGYGTVFRYDLASGVETLHVFDGGELGGTPAHLALGGDGALYGSTSDGGNNGLGTLFKLDPIAGLSVLTDFSGWEDFPPGGVLLTRGADGLVYGLASNGAQYGYGTLLRIESDGNLTVLHELTEEEGGTISTPLTLGPDGTLYGVNGKFIRFSPDGAVQTGASLSAETGQGPESPLVVGEDGMLYAALNNNYLPDGGVGLGTVVRFSPQTGSATVIHAFMGGDAGATPSALVKGDDGRLYGATRSGAGGNGDPNSSGGTFFALEVTSVTPAGSNVEVQPVDPVTGTAPVNLTFGEIVQPGTTSVTTSTSTSAPPPPPTFNLGSTPTYFDVETTAVFAGPIQVCFNYAGVVLVDPARAKLLHFNGTVWEDVTTSNSVATTTICGSVTSLSPFVIGNETATAYSVNPLFDQEKVYKAGSTIPIRIQILANGTNASAITLPVVATGIRRKTVDTNWGTPDDPGQSNPDYNFTFTTVGGAPGYRFNLKTGKTYRGTYELKFTVGGGGQELIVEFQVR
jgi:uncharacterized repeat protein (TIGR03803 family)